MQDQALEALSRSNLYGMLARVARSEVDADMLAEFRKPEVAEALREAGLDVAATLAWDDEGFLLEDLNRAYTHLFLLTVNPHESVQRGQGQLWGDHTVAVQNFMEEVGLGMPEGKSLLPDHMAIELELMQHLCAEEAAALSVGDPDGAAEHKGLQMRFMKEHLGQWGIEFWGSMERLASHDFYKLTARLAREFLSGDKAALLGA